MRTGVGLYALLQTRHNGAPMNTPTINRTLLPTRRGASAAKVILIIVIVLLVLAGICGIAGFLGWGAIKGAAGEQARASIQANAVIQERIGTISEIDLAVGAIARAAQAGTQPGGLAGFTVTGDKGTGDVIGVFNTDAQAGTMTMTQGVLEMGGSKYDLSTGQVVNDYPWNTAAPTPAVVDPPDAVDAPEGVDPAGG